jgi:Phage integrase, N-terminal SAM-like domain
VVASLDLSFEVHLVHDAIRLKHSSLHTEQAYVTWIKRYIFFQKQRHPNDTGSAEIKAFLRYLAVRQKIVAFHPKPALSALLVL